MKYEIVSLINSENAELKFNRFCTLRRWVTNDGLGGYYDCLYANFAILSSRDCSIEIKARTWEEVINEVIEAQTKAFSESAETLNKELKNGYIRG